MHTLADPLNHAARNYADSPATICSDVRLNYRELTERCRRLGGALNGLGLKTGDRIAILAANALQYVEIYMAVPAAGFVVVPLNMRHAEAELAYALEDSGTKILLTETGQLITGLHHEERMPHSDLLRSCGQPLPGVAIRIVGQEGNELPAGEVGKVAVGGPNIMLGYWNKPEQTAAALNGG